MARRNVPRARSAPPAQTWWVRQGDDVQGPFDLERMRAWTRSGKLDPAVHVSPDGERWGLAGNVKAFRERRRRPGSTRTRGWEFHRVMKEHTPHTHVTHTILGLNVLVYLLMILGGLSAFSPSAESLVDWGGNYGPHTTNGAWWRLLTSTFVHSGIWHLFGNMLFFWYIGRFMERLVGQVGYVVLYVGSGVTASLASLVWDPSLVSIGASGALFGLFGGVLGFVVRRDRDRVAQGVLRIVKNAALAFLAWQILFGLGNTSVDHAAHIGGVIGGFGLGFLLAHPLTAAGVALRARRAVVATAAALALTVLVAALLPRYGDFHAFLRTFAATVQRVEPKVQAGQAGTITPEAYAQALEQEVIPGWEDLVRRGESLGRMPGRFVEAAEALERCLALRLKALRTRLACLAGKEAAAPNPACDAADEQERAAQRAFMEMGRALIEARRRGSG